MIILPECVIRTSVIWEVREGSLVDVKNPDILPVLAQRQVPGVVVGGGADELAVHPVLPAEHVVPHVVLALHWDDLPVLDVVHLDGEPPAEAVDARDLAAGRPKLRPERVYLVRDGSGGIRCCQGEGEGED